MGKKPEISWSLMHPTKLDTDYMRKVLELSGNFKVDSFEICATCHTPLGGLDGLVLYEDFPLVAASLERDEIIANQKKLNKILKLAHNDGKPVFYWHREVTVFPAFLQVVPELRDANGEFNLLGEAFDNLLRYKLRKTFEAVPTLDGVVLTLTEADFSVIHNSAPEVYPPEKVVEHIIRIFAEELNMRGKRFILRSFGSIAKDYEDILAGATLAAKDFSFEVETKITPYDFDPFLPENPFLKKIPNLSMGTECDCVGEFLGAGYLPAEDIENIVRYVRYAQKQGVDRYAIRIDRIGNTVLDTYPINLYAYHRAIEDVTMTADNIRREYTDKFYPASCRSEISSLGQMGYELVTKLHYIKGNVIFHQFPLQPSLKWLKAGGIFALFKEKIKLKQLSGIWSILSRNITPSTNALLNEKLETVFLAAQGLNMVYRLQNQLSETEYARLYRLWHNAQIAAEAISAFVKTMILYFEQMESRQGSENLIRFIQKQESEVLMPLLTNPGIENSEVKFVNGMVQDVFQYCGDNNLDDIYLKPLMKICRMLVDEFEAERAAREKWRHRAGVIDFVIPGAITDEWRCGRYMHASHAVLEDLCPARWIGNQVFPNGFLELRLKGTSEQPQQLWIDGRGNFKVTINGEIRRFNTDGIVKLELPSNKELTIRFEKADRDYPLLRAVATVVSSN